MVSARQFARLIFTTLLLTGMAIAGNSATGTIRLGVYVVSTVQVQNPNHPNQPGQAGTFSMGDGATVHLAIQQDWEHSQEIRAITMEQSENPQNTTALAPAHSAVLIRHTYIGK